MKRGKVLACPQGAAGGWRSRGWRGQSAESQDRVDLTRVGGKTWARAWAPCSNDQAAPQYNQLLTVPARRRDREPVQCTRAWAGQWIVGLFTLARPPHPKPAGTMAGTKASYATTLAAACQPQRPAWLPGLVETAAAWAPTAIFHRGAGCTADTHVGSRGLGRS